MNEPLEARAVKFDVGFGLILLLLIVVVGWLLSMPFCRFVQRSTLNRFHLQTSSFAAWSLQQPIPSMYNFYNRYEIGSAPLEAGSKGYWDKGTVNHFPLRMFTFGDNRAFFLSKPERRQIDAWSSYRGVELHTRWLAVPAEDGGFEFTGEVVP